MEELLAMSKKELDRYHILQKVLDRQLKQSIASQLLGIKERQIRYLLTNLKRYGPQGLISKRRGKTSNHCKPKKLKQTVIGLVSEHYEGYGPKLAKEKLEERHGIVLSVETVRLWMIEHHLWISRKKNKAIHRTRYRRECFGELIQGDGSHHHWFGEDLPPANATVFIDDATSKLTALVFSKGETLDSYFQALEQHINRYGRPRALYTDKFSIFQSNSKDKNGPTQMQRALKELEIELILANSPQAKGRVERANRTLQDRLVKEFSLRGIKTIEDANDFAKEFVEIYNEKFSKEPMNNLDVHRPLEGYDLSCILCRREVRTLNSSLSFQFNKKIYQVQEIPNHRLKGCKVDIRLDRDNEMRIFLKGKEIKALPLDQVLDVPVVLSRKELLDWQPRAVKSSHPWKKYGHQLFREKVKSYEAQMV